MKFNFGHGIAVFYIFFIVVLLSFVLKSTTHDNSLVMDNYYEQDLNYQRHYEKIKNGNSVKNQILVKNLSEQQEIYIQFPDNNNISGKLLLFNPSSKYLDIHKKIELDQSGKMTISTENMHVGRWKVKLDWEQNGKLFYIEKEILL